MKRPWYYRMLLSYLPIVFFISSFLFFVFFQELSAQSRRDAVKANKVLNLLAMDKVENTLYGIDYAMIDYSLNNKVLSRFFQADDKRDVVMNKDVLKEIDVFKRQNPLVDSIYLYRSGDGVVLTESYMFAKDEFTGKTYIDDVLRAKSSVKWTTPHAYQEFDKSIPKQVVSLARVHYTALGERCLLVVNVKIDSLRLLVEQIYNPDVSFVSIAGPQGKDVLGNLDELDDRQVLAENTSDYLNWTFSSGLEDGTLSSFAFGISKHWLLLGVVVVILGLIAIVVVTRRNYRPIEHVVAQIHSLGNDKPEQTASGANEFSLIETAIEDLKKRSTVDDKRNEEEMTLRKKHFLYEVIEGIRHISDEEWSSEMAKYGLPASVKGAQVLAIEIDNYAAFCSRFSKKDQHLLMYAIHNSAKEMFHRHRLSCWCEWVTGKRLICIILQTDGGHEGRARQACEEFLRWVALHLPLSATIGEGSTAAHHDLITISYREALQAVTYKFFKGLGTIIGSGESKVKPGAELFGYLQSIRSLAQDFRMGTPGWGETFHQIFDDIRTAQLPKDDAISLLNYMVFHLERSIGELAPEYQKPWHENGLLTLTDVLDHTETLLDIQTQFYAILHEMSQLIGSAFEANHHHQLLLEVRGYIEMNFTDPEMSLDRLKDRFGLSQKYLSQLFKDKFGEGFMDFLIRLRMEYAKTLLRTTPDTIQSIAGKSGYSNVISFTRAFKKVSSMSPGDYRRQESQPRISHR